MEISVEAVAVSNFADDFSGERVGGVAGNGGELFSKGFCNVGVGSVDFVVEGNGLVGGRGVVFTRKGFEEGPEFGRVGSMVGFREGFLPFFVGVLVNY